MNKGKDFYAILYHGKLIKGSLKVIIKKCTNKGFNQQQSSKEIWMQQKKDKKRRTNHTRVTTKKQLCFGMHDWRN